MIQPDSFGSFADLVDQVRQGDQLAWDYFVKAYDPKLKSVIRNRMRLMNSRSRSLYDTCDFTSEIWKTLMVRLPNLTIRDEAEFMGFMSHVACQKIMDVMRKQMTMKRDSSREVSLHEKTDIFRPMDPKSHEPTPSQYAMAEEVRQALTHESEEVDSDSALIMKLKSQNYTNHEISQSTGIHLRKVQRLVKNIKHRFFQSKS